MTDDRAQTLRKLYLPMVGVALAVIALDQLTKAWATGLDRCAALNPRPTVGFCLAHNEGMAFSVGWGSGAIISAVAVTIVVVLFVAARKMPLSARLIMGAIAGGALGNVLDRAFRVAADTTAHRGFMGGAVVDFIYSSFWATFNVADSAVVVGGIVLSILLWRLPEPTGEPEPTGNGESTGNGASPGDGDSPGNGDNPGNGDSTDDSTATLTS
jgi:signal peptidase II